MVNIQEAKIQIQEQRDLLSQKQTEATQAGSKLREAFIEKALIKIELTETKQKEVNKILKNESIENN